MVAPNLMNKSSALMDLRKSPRSSNNSLEKEQKSVLKLQNIQLPEMSLISANKQGTLDRRNSQQAPDSPETKNKGLKKVNFEVKIVKKSQIFRSEAPSPMTPNADT